MARCAILRTHGGLGNQLFQILYGRLFAERNGRALREVHDLSYAHAFPRSTLIAQAEAPSRLQKTISDLRIPKVLNRVVRRSEAPLLLGRDAYLDGYYQSVTYFERYSAAMIAAQLDRLAGELGVQPAARSETLVHLRLGDFFGDQEQARAHAEARVAKLPNGAHLMTNDEDLVQTAPIAETLARQNITLISTKGFSAEQVLCAMAQYPAIEANDSTLSFWAAVLGRARLTLSDPILRKSFAHFTGILAQTAIMPA